MAKIIIAPNVITIKRASLIFLAGPIQGAGEWHKEAIEIIHSINTEIYVASPKRQKRRSGDFTEEMYNEQVDWETTYLKRAASNGTILFWLAKEEMHSCDRAFAQTSRFELAEWKSRYEVYDTHLVVGIEEGFPGARYIRRRFSQDCPKITIHSSLEETCKDAIKLITGR